MAVAVWFTLRNLTIRTLNLGIRVAIHFLLRTNHSAKCPACGRRDWHRVEWAPTYDRLLHMHEKRTIRRWGRRREVGCGAVWAEAPMAKVESWKVTTPMMQMPGELAPGVPDGAAIPRAPWEGQVPIPAQSSTPSTPMRPVGPGGRPVPLTDTRTRTTTVHEMTN